MTHIHDIEGLQACAHLREAAMVGLTPLRTELLLMICNELHMPKAKDAYGYMDVYHYSRGNLGSLAALACTNRRLTSIACPILHNRGVKCHSHLLLAWPAKRGVAGSLNKALAAGASLDLAILAGLTLPALHQAGAMYHVTTTWAARKTVARILVAQDASYRTGCGERGLTPVRFWISFLRGGGTLVKGG